MLRAVARLPSALRSHRDVVELHKDLLRGWKVRVETLCEDAAAVRAAPRVVFANLNQMGHMGAIGVVVATDEVLNAPSAMGKEREVPFIVNLGWKLFPLVGWCARWRYTIIRQIPRHGLAVMNRVTADFRAGAITACYMSVEGVRARHPDVVSPFRKGCAHLALAADAVIVPVLMSRSCFHLWPFGSALPRVEPTGGVLRYKFLRPIFCQGKSVSEITSHLRSLVHSFD